MRTFFSTIVDLFHHVHGCDQMLGQSLEIAVGLSYRANLTTYTLGTMKSVKNRDTMKDGNNR